MRFILVFLAIYRKALFENSYLVRIIPLIYIQLRLSEINVYG